MFFSPWFASASDAVRLADILPVFVLEQQREDEESGQEKEHQDPPVPAARLAGLAHVGQIIHQIGRVSVVFEARHPSRQLNDELRRDRKSTRLNSSHANISYAVFCLKKK